MIEVSTVDHVLRVTMNRPDKRNALSPDMLQELRHAFDSAIDQDAVSVVLLRAEGPSFCAGYDLTGRYAEAGRPESPWVDREHLRRMTQVIESVWNCPLPVVAAVQGDCLAGGADLLLHCDFVVMAADARIAHPPTRFLGTPPSHLWVQRVGLDEARRILLLGEQLDAERAAARGFATTVVTVAELDLAASEFAARLGSAARELLISNKWLINRTIDLTGRTLLNRMAETEDALAHTSAASRSFKERAVREGLKAALQHQDSRP